MKVEEDDQSQNITQQTNQDNYASDSVEQNRQFLEQLYFNKNPSQQSNKRIS